MSTTAETVVQARAALKQAESLAQAEQREQDIGKLKTVRNELRHARVRYEQLRRAVKTAEVRVALAGQEVAQYAQYISQSLEAKPTCADLLPDDADVRAWSGRHDQLLALYDRALVRRTEEQAKMPDRMEAVRLKESPTSVITQLEYVEGNLLRKLQGEAPGGGWKGGISSVR